MHIMYLWLNTIACATSLSGLLGIGKVGPVQNPRGVTACDSHVLVQIFAKCGENRVSHGLEHFSKQHLAGVPTLLECQFSALKLN